MSRLDVPQDYVGIYTTESWELVRHFQVDSVDLEDLAWSPDDTYLAIWDAPLEYKLLIYSPHGRKLADYQAYDNALGIKGVTWSPSSQFLAVGSYDEVCRVFTTLTWYAWKHWQTQTETQTHLHALVHLWCFLLVFLCVCVWWLSRLMCMSSVG